jgi:uncharacterized protein
MQKIALITGGSKGIGKALAEQFAQHGYSLILIARHLEELQQASNDIKKKYPCEINILVADLEKPEAIDLILQTYKVQLNQIEVLVNNAGFGMAEKLVDTPPEVINGMIAVNMTALTNLTYRILPFMLANKRGKILNLASTAAFTPGPFYCLYYATKAFVLSLSVALTEECQSEGIGVSVLCPGATESEYHDRARARQKNIKLLKLIKMLTVEEVAKAGYQGLMNNKRVIVPGLTNKLAVLLMNLTPAVLKSKIVGWMDRP